MIQALKNAYPDPSQIPAPLQQWTVKAEASEDKDRTRNLHKETTRLGQAQKMLMETRSAMTSYEKAWKDHVMAALTLLKEQKESYQQQRSQLADMERKAIIELTGARRAIAKLNKVEDKREVIAVDDEELKEDNEEMAMAEEIVEDSSMKEFLEQYAASVGLTVFYPTGRRARSYRAGAEKTQRWQRWASFSRGRRATSGSPAKVALSQKACWYIFCGHDEVPAQIEISHAVEAACEAKSTYHHHLFRHSVCNSKDYVSPVQALFNAQRLAHEVAQDNLVDIKGQTRFCDGVDTPLHCRLLDERSSVSVSAGAEEYTHLDGLERNGDPEDEQLVIIDGWQDLLDILHQHTPSPDFLLHLEMYGLHITHHSIRITECEATIAAIREAVQQSWRDAMPPRSVAYIHLVRPQEHRHARAVVLQLVVEIVPFGVDIPPNDVPILRRIRWHRDHSMTLETAYMRDHQTGYELLFDAHLDEWCHPRHGVQCNLHIESRIALMAHRHHLLPGSLLEIFIHDDDRPGFSVSSTDSSQHADLQPELQQPASCNPDILQEWLAECSCSHVALVMYGLFGSSLGTRYATSQADHQQVRSAVLHAWQDHVHPETSVALLMVRPQDDQHLDHLHLIVEFTSPSQARPAGYLPILQRISWHNIWQGDTSAAVYRVSGQNMRQLLAACSLSEWCGPSTRAICRVQVRKDDSFQSLSPSSCRWAG